MYFKLFLLAASKAIGLGIDIDIAITIATCKAMEIYTASHNRKE